jgi:hypothetical protein
VSAYFKVSLPQDGLPWYAYAPNGATAIKMVERFAGSADLNGRTRYQALEVKSEQVPTWYEVFGEPEEIKVERQKEEEF